jgi:hypothetical protein
MDIEHAQIAGAGRHGALHGNDLVVADLPVMAPDSAKILAVANTFLSHFSC